MFNTIVFVSFNSNTVGVICSAGTNYSFGTIRFNLGFFVGLMLLRFRCSVSWTVVCLLVIFSVGHCIVCPSIYGF